MGFIARRKSGVANQIALTVAARSRAEMLIAAMHENLDELRAIVTGEEGRGPQRADR